MIDIKSNLADAVAFAVSLPTDQVHLCAIHPAGNRPVVGQSFPKTESGQAAILRWLTEADRKGYGIYFNANEVKPFGKGRAKAKEAEVSTVRFLHVDADLPAGTGKGWIGYMLRVLLGDQNVAMIESDDPVKDMFNGWTLNRQLGFIHELMPDRRVDLASRLKGVITESHFWVNEKFIARYRAENRTNLFCCSNHRDVLKIARKDRRWLVVQGASDPFARAFRSRATRSGIRSAASRSRWRFPRC
jgi:hypothetical protein